MSISYHISLNKYIKFSQNPLSLLIKSKTSIISLQQFTFYFIDFKLMDEWPLPPK